MRTGLFETRINCIEAIANSEGSWLFNFAIVSYHKSKLTLIRNSNQSCSIDELVPNLEKRNPATLMIAGKGVIIRKVNQAEDFDDAGLLEKVFPDIRMKEILFERIKTSDMTNILSICRRSIVDKVIAQLEGKGIRVIECFVGPLTITNLLPLFDSQTDFIHAGGYKISCDGKSFRDIMATDNRVVEEYNLGGTKVRSLCIPAFAGGFTYLFINSKRTFSDIAIVKENGDLFKLKNRLFKYSILGLFILMLMLLINYFVFTAFDNKYTILSNAFSRKSVEAAKHDSLATLLQQREELLHASLKGSSIRCSFFFDRVFETCKGGVKLDELTYAPIGIKQDASLEPDIKPCTMEAQATLNDNIQLSEWLKRIESIPHVVSAEFTNYRQIDDKRSAVKLIIRLR